MSYSVKYTTFILIIEFILTVFNLAFLWFKFTLFISLTM